jgi:hypothetical protein
MFFFEMVSQGADHVRSESELNILMERGYGWHLDFEAAEALVRARRTPNIWGWDYDPFERDLYPRRAPFA